MAEGTTPAQTAKPEPRSATLPKVRRNAFPFGEPEPLKKHYVEGDIVFSHLVSMLSAGFPPGEESFIRSVRKYAGQIGDPVLKKRVAAFIGQEAMHGREHRALNDKIVELGFPLVRAVNSIQEGTWQDNAYIWAGFHPDDIDTTALLEKWQQELFGSGGPIANYPSARKTTTTTAVK